MEEAPKESVPMTEEAAKPAAETAKPAETAPAKEQEAAPQGLDALRESQAVLVETTKSSSWQEHVKPHKELQEVVPGCLWILEGTWGKKNENTRNMTVYKMKTGGLWLHSVVAINDEELKKLEAIGPVEVIVVPNCAHTLDGGVFKERFPKAKLMCPPEIRAKIESVKTWAFDADVTTLSTDTGVTAHKPSGVKNPAPVVVYEYIYELALPDGTALVISDYLMNMPKTNPGHLKFLLGTSFQIPRINRIGTFSNKKEFKTFLEGLAKENLKVITLGHGPVETENASAKLKEAAAGINKL